MDLSALIEPNLTRRAAAMLDEARRAGVEAFTLEPEDVVLPRPRLLLLFVAALMNVFPALEMPAATLPGGPTPHGAGGASTTHSAQTREERALRHWLISLGAQLSAPELRDTMRDGLLLLKVMEHLDARAVDWARVSDPAASIYQCVENCNYALELARGMGLVVQGIDGKDLTDGKFTHALLWQLMRCDALQLLEQVRLSLKEKALGITPAHHPSPLTPHPILAPPLGQRLGEGDPRVVEREARRRQGRPPALATDRQGDPRARGGRQPHRTGGRGRQQGQTTAQRNAQAAAADAAAAAA